MNFLHSASEIIEGSITNFNKIAESENSFTSFAIFILSKSTNYSFNFFRVERIRVIFSSQETHDRGGTKNKFFYLIIKISLNEDITGEEILSFAFFLTVFNLKDFFHRNENILDLSAEFFIIRHSRIEKVFDFSFVSRKSSNDIPF